MGTVVVLKMTTRHNVLKLLLPLDRLPPAPGIGAATSSMRALGSASQPQLLLESVRKLYKQVHWAREMTTSQALGEPPKDAEGQPEASLRLTILQSRLSECQGNRTHVKQQGKVVVLTWNPSTGEAERFLGLTGEQV
ncbi:hypothetical protein STEG23_029530 [Scotinomys teguina]